MVGCELAYRLKLRKRGGECRGIVGWRRRAAVDQLNQRQQFLDRLNDVSGRDSVACAWNLERDRMPANGCGRENSALSNIREVRRQRGKKSVIKRCTAGLRAIVNRAKKEALECGACHRIQQGRFVLIGTEAV